MLPGVSAEAVVADPELGAVNTVVAHGSAQAVFHLATDSHLTVSHFGRSPDLDDGAMGVAQTANLATTGDWAVLGIQELGRPDGFAAMFLSLPGMCPIFLAGQCEPFEKPIIMRGDWRGWSPSRGTMPAGQYVVAVIAPPGARTTATFRLEGADGASTVELGDATPADAEIRRGGSVRADRWSGSLEAILDDASYVAGGFLSAWGPHVSSAAKAYELCIDFERESACVSFTGPDPVSGSGAAGAAFHRDDVPAGPFKMWWKFEREHLLPKWADWLIVWPLQ